MIINIFKFSTVRYYIFCEFANYIYSDTYYKEFNDTLNEDNIIDNYKCLLTTD